MCDSIPPTEDPPENYHVDNVSRQVGQIVTVFCRNKTVAVLKCLPDRTWNATVPACAAADPNDNMSALLIIVWVVGGVLLFSLLILIIIIVTSRRKAGSGGRSSSPTTRVFHISGSRGGRQGGDNPAFSRADERCGEWSFHRPSERSDSTRLPSYQEAILNNYITVPATAGNANQQDRPTFIRANAPPSYRSSQLQTTRTSGGADATTSQSSTTGQSDVRSSSITTAQTASANQRSEGSSAQTASANQRSEGSSAQTASANQRSEGSSSSTSRETTEVTVHVGQANVSTNERRRAESDPARRSRRYAENYPQCIFEEDPPPPYSPGPADYNIYRSPARQSQHNPRDGNNWRRSMHAVPTSHASQRQEDDVIRLIQHHRRSLHERPTHARPSQISQRQLATNQTTFQSANQATSDATQHRQALNYQHSSAVTTNHPTSSTNQRLPIISSTTAPSSLTVNHPSSATSNPSSSSSVPHPYPANSYSVSAHAETSPNTVATSVNNCTILPNVASVSQVPSSITPTTQSAYVSTITIGGGDYYVYDGTRRSEAANREHLYVIRSTQATPSAPPFYLNPDSLIASSHHHHHLDVQPLSTSTPLNQSPAPARRFAPVNHVMPPPITDLSIPVNQREEPSTAPAHNVHQEQLSVPRYSTQPSNSGPLHVVRPRQPIAPIARIESDYL